MDARAVRLRTAMTAMCDASTPRVSARPQKRQVYWWSEEIEALRSASMKARRAYLRSRLRRSRDNEHEAKLHQAYRAAKKALKIAICRAKTGVWEEFLGKLYRDP